MGHGRLRAPDIAQRQCRRIISTAKIAEIQNTSI